MGTILWESLSAWWPEVILSGAALLVFLLGAWERWTRAVLVCAWASLGGAAAALWRVPSAPEGSLFFGFITCDGFSAVFRWIALGTVALILLLMMASRELPRHRFAEGVGLLLLVGVGLMLMAEAAHLLTAYLAIELVSLSSYLLVGWLEGPRSAEASLKYLLFGALSSAVMLFGMSLLFGLTGALAFADLARATVGLGEPLLGAVVIACTLLLVGLAFKVSLVPFHMWTPDAYEGAPVAVTALLSVGPKAAALALLARVLQAVPPLWPSVAPLFVWLTIATMTLGTVVALVQTNVKRLFAYSTIAQVGYLLMGLVAGTPAGREALLVYLLAYLFMNTGAFAVIVAVVDDRGSESLEAFRGLAQRAPALALACGVFLLSLAGLPPLFGFFGKFLLIGSALEAHQVGLAVAAVLNSAAGLYIYVNLLRLMYLAEPETTRPLRPAVPLRIALGVCAAATIGFGLFPSPVWTSLRTHAAMTVR